VDHQNRSRQPFTQPPGRCRVATFEAEMRRRQRLAIDLQRPSDRVLDLFRRVRLGEDAPREERDEL